MHGGFIIKTRLNNDRKIMRLTADVQIILFLNFCFFTLFVKCFLKKLGKMEGTESTHNTKISDSAYSNSCSNSQSQRSGSSSKSRQSNSSGSSSGYGGKQQNTDR